MSIGALEEFGIRQETVNAFSFYDYFLRLIFVLSLRMENNLCKKKSAKISRILSICAEILVPPSPIFDCSIFFLVLQTLLR